MSAPPYMKLFWGDYHKRTRHLKRDQHGAYFLLIGEAWQLGGALPDDDTKLAAWALCTPQEWAAMKPIVMEFFALRRGKWWHDRVREELASYEATSRKRKEAGKKGGKASGGNARENQEANACLLPTEPEPEPEPKIREAIASLSLAQAGPTRTDIARGFLAFWAEYPKRVGKDAAAKSFDRAMRRADGPDPLETIMAGLRRALPGWDDPQFIPNPTTWLNQGRWTDDTPAVRGPHDRPANDYRRPSLAQPSRAERDQSAALEVLARRGALPRQDFGGDLRDCGPSGAEGVGGGGLAILPTGHAA